MTSLHCFSAFCAGRTIRVLLFPPRFLRIVNMGSNVGVSCGRESTLGISDASSDYLPVFVFKDVQQDGA
jgi:hypothetical protein